MMTTHYPSTTGRDWVPFDVAPLDDDERAYVRACVKRARMRPILKECFSNSQRVILGDGENRLAYAEGWAGMHHGWLTIGGKVVDLTLSPAALGLRLHVPKSIKGDIRFRMAAATEDLNDRMAGDYFGVQFTKKEVAAFVITNGAYGSMIDPIDVERRGKSR